MAFRLGEYRQNESFLIPDGNTHADALRSLHLRALFELSGSKTHHCPSHLAAGVTNCLKRVRALEASRWANFTGILVGLVIAELQVWNIQNPSK